MPPETKPVISSLAEMTCENCVYSVVNNPDNKDKNVCECLHMRSDSWLPTLDSFCNEGKWLCNDSIYLSVTIEHEAPWVTDYDDCYQMFGRGK